MWCIAVFRKVLFMQRIPFLMLSLWPTVTLQTLSSNIEVGAPLKSVLKSAKTTKVVTNVTLSERDDIVQFLVSWDDNMPKDTSYNIVISTLNETGCSEPPCSAYGVIKKSNHILIPESPMTHVDQDECAFMFGCNYSVRVETSNASVSGYGTVSVPYCVMGVCSCQHAGDLPKVMTSLAIPNNETIICNWIIKHPTKKDFIKLRSNVTNHKWRLYSIISEQTNPLLSWGGQLKPITEHLYPLENLTSINTNGTMKGTFEIRIPRQLVPKTVLKHRSYIIDNLNCGGPEHFAKITVPEFVGIEGKEESTDFNLVNKNIVEVGLIG